MLPSPLQAIILSPLPVTTLGRSIDCNPLCSPLKLAFGEEFRAFPISSPPPSSRGAAFFLPPPQDPFCTITTQHFTPHFLALARSHQVRLERVSDFPRLVLEPYVLTLRQPGNEYWVLSPAALCCRRQLMGFFSSGFDKVKRTVTRGTQTCQPSKCLVVKLGERPQKTLVSTHDPSE